MRNLLAALSLIVFVVSSSALAGPTKRETYRWKDDNGEWHYGDKVPPEAAEKDKDVLNEHAIPVGSIEGKKSEEELERERIEEELRLAREEEQRENRALLATYLTTDEIIDHRNRRIELFDAQARVTELFLKNLERRLVKLMAEANRFQPYSDDPQAPMVDPDLVDEIDITRDTITRHEANLEKFREDKQAIMEKFDRDLKRFEELKGLTANNG